MARPFDIYWLRREVIMVLVAWQVLGLLAPGRMNTQARRQRDMMRSLSSTSAAAHVNGSAPARTGVGRVRPTRRGSRAQTRPVECSPFLGR